jgi:hypothetical protein
LNLVSGYVRLFWPVMINLQITFANRLVVWMWVWVNLVPLINTSCLFSRFLVVSVTAHQLLFTYSYPPTIPTLLVPDLTYFCSLPQSVGRFTIPIRLPEYCLLQGPPRRQPELVDWRGERSSGGHGQRSEGRSQPGDDAPAPAEESHVAQPPHHWKPRLLANGECHTPETKS